MIRVLVVDDHDVVRAGVRGIMESALRAEVGEAKTPQEALARVRERDWDVVILDISLDGRSGLDLLNELRGLRPRLPVLILSASSEEQYALMALKVGAAGYVTKGSPKEDLVGAVRRVVEGGKYISPSLAERMAEHLTGRPDEARHEGLSGREYEVMRMLAAGRKPSQIAEELSLSVKTVSTYRARVLQKLGLRTTAELIHYAARHKIID